MSKHSKGKKWKRSEDTKLTPREQDEQEIERLRIRHVEEAPEVGTQQKR